MTAGRIRAEQWGQGKIRAFRLSEAKLARKVAPNKKRPTPAPFIGKGPCAPAYFPYLNHRTQAEIMAAEARG